MTTSVINKNLKDLLKDLVATNQIPDVEIENLVIDSRELQAGDLFIAVAGTQAHGLDYLQSVLNAKPALIVYEPTEKYSNVQTKDVPCIAIKNLRQYVSSIAARYFAFPSASLDITAITGTNGKTTCAYLLAQLLSSQGVDVAIIGTTGSGRLGDLKKSILTTPDAISLQKRLYELKASGVQHVVMEASSHALDQCRLEAVEVNVAAFTNLTQDHLDYHQDMSSYLTAKAKLFSFESLACAVLNADELSFDILKNQTKPLVRIATYSSLGNSDADLYAQSIELNALQTTLQVSNLGNHYEFSSKLLGHFNVANLLLALSVMQAYGCALESLNIAVENLMPPSGRLECFGESHTPKVVIDYAHTPDALEKALTTLKTISKEDLSAVFGCGGDRDKSKRSIMGAIAQQYAQRIYLTDDNPRTESSLDILNDIKSGMQGNTKIQIIPNRAEAIKTSISEASEHDIILIAGKGHEEYQVIGTEKIPFSDQLHAQAALQEWQELRS